MKKNSWKPTNKQFTKYAIHRYIVAVVTVAVVISAIAVAFAVVISTIAVVDCE